MLNHAIKKMLPVWQEWMPERTAFLRLFESADFPLIYPEYSKAGDLPRGMVLGVLHDPCGLPMALYSDFLEAIAEASAHGFVVARVWTLGKAAQPGG